MGPKRDHVKKVYGQCRPRNLNRTMSLKGIDRYASCAMVATSSGEGLGAGEQIGRRLGLPGKLQQHSPPAHYPACEKIGVPPCRPVNFSRYFSNIRPRRNHTGTDDRRSRGQFRRRHAGHHIQSQDRMKRVETDQLGNKLCKIAQNS
jgi:hypothetical protein